MALCIILVREAEYLNLNLSSTTKQSRSLDDHAKLRVRREDYMMLAVLWRGSKRGKV